MMKRKVKILLCVTLFGVLFLSLTGNASAAVDFPADEAGICAYVKANVESKESIDLEDVKPALAGMARQTDDYIIGTVDVAGDYTEEQLPYVYVSTDGWVVAYYPNDWSSGWLLPWNYYSGGATLSCTTLSKAVEKVCYWIDGTTDGLKYYDFRHPNATEMMIIAEEAYDTSQWFTVTIPSNFHVYRVDWSHNPGSSSRDHEVKLDGVTFSATDKEGYIYGSFDPAVEFQEGLKHKINITGSSRYAGYIGLVIEYSK